MDGILEVQAAADADYFFQVCGRALPEAERDRIQKTILAAYRWQYIGSGLKDERFRKILGGMVTEAQMKRISAALSPILS